MYKKILVVCALMTAAVVNATDKTKPLPEGTIVTEVTDRSDAVGYRAIVIKTKHGLSLGKPHILSVFKVGETYEGSVENLNNKATPQPLGEDVAPIKFAQLEAHFKAQQKKDADSKEAKSDKA